MTVRVHKIAVEVSIRIVLLPLMSFSVVHTRWHATSSYLQQPDLPGVEDYFIRLLCFPGWSEGSDHWALAGGQLKLQLPV